MKLSAAATIIELQPPPATARQTCVERVLAALPRDGSWRLADLVVERSELPAWRAWPVLALLVLDGRAEQRRDGRFMWVRTGGRTE